MDCLSHRERYQIVSVPMLGARCAPCRHVQGRSIPVWRRAARGGADPPASKLAYDGRFSIETVTGGVVRVSMAGWASSLAAYWSWCRLGPYRVAADRAGETFDPGYPCC